MHIDIGKINLETYNCITYNITTDKVIITENQVQHIKERHPNDYEFFSSYFKEIVENPDFIIQTKKPYTALILKEFPSENLIFKTVLRLATPVSLS